MVSPKRVDTPLMTIEAMVQVGPWLVKEVRHGHWRNCDRCETDHKQVWECVVNADDATVAEHLGGQRTWLIGSVCGPKLMLLTDAIWGQQYPDGFWEQQTQDLSRKVKLALDATRALSESQSTGVESVYREWIVAGLEGLKRNVLTRHQEKVLRSHTNSVLNAIRFARYRAQKQLAEAVALSRSPSRRY